MTRSLPAKVLLLANQDPRVPHNGVNSHSRALASALGDLGVPVERRGAYDGSGRLRLAALKAGARASRLPAEELRTREADLKLSILGGALTRLRLPAGCAAHAQDYLSAVAAQGIPGAPPVVLAHHANGMPADEYAQRYGLRRDHPALGRLVELQARAYGAARYVCPVSTWAAARVAESGLVSGDRLVVVPSGVPVPDAPAARPPGGARVVCVAQLVRRKGIDLLIEAIGPVRARVPGATLTVVGDGPARRELESLAGAVAPAGAVRFTGAVRSAEPALAEADLFVLPSRLDNLPMALLEAMAAALPVVATRVGGVSDAVADGKTGLLVSAEDRDALADAVVALLLDPQRRAAMGAAGWERARDRFSTGAMASAFLDLYRSALAWRGAAAAAAAAGEVP